MVKRISQTKDIRGDRHGHLLPAVELNEDYLAQFEPLGSEPEFIAFCRVISSNRNLSNWETGLSRADVNRVHELLQDRADSQARCEGYKKDCDTVSLGRESRIQAAITGELNTKQDRASKELFERRVGQMIQNDLVLSKTVPADQIELIKRLGSN